MPSQTLELQTKPVANRSGATVIIVADDLTGAADSGVAFLASGQTVRIVLAAHSSSAPHPPAGVIACNTETRNLPQPDAAASVAETVALLAHSNPNALVFKKIDSAARGNFAAEILAALDASRAALALVAPAFPHAGRTVRSGVLTVRDFSGQHATISLPDQFPTLNPSQVAILPADSVANLHIAIRNAIANGTRILLCDAETQDDLDRLAAAAATTPQPILWAGSSGLARALSATLHASVPEAPQPRPSRTGRTLLFSGSPHPVTALQLSHLEEHSPDLKNSAIRLLSDAPTADEIRHPFAAEPVASLILTGGDTASFVLNALGASSILLAGEIAPGIPWGIIENGLADGCIVVTKSGGFGDRDALVRAFEFCSRRSS